MSATTEWTTRQPMFPPTATGHDPDTGAQYITVGIGPVAFTVHVSDHILVDYDQHGLPVGVEVLL